MRMLLPVLGQLVARCQRSSLALIKSPYSPCTTPSPEIRAQTLPQTLSQISSVFSWKWPQLVEGGNCVSGGPMELLSQCNSSGLDHHLGSLCVRGFVYLL